jgi:hypothetical protein
MGINLALCCVKVLMICLGLDLQAKAFEAEKGVIATKSV